MKNTSRFALFFGIVSLLSVTVVHQSHAGVVYIDLLNTAQYLTVQKPAAGNSRSVTNTVSSLTSIGGFRTVRLSITNATGSTNPITSFEVGSGTASLSSPNQHRPSFEITWGGAGGTSGLGGVDVMSGLPYANLNNTFVKYSLLSSDRTNNTFTWRFTDVSNNIASYSSSFPEYPESDPPNPAIPYSISLASFAGAGSINWNSINFISLSGGGTPGFDVTFAAPFSTEVIPEPGTWAAAGLLLIAAVYIRWRRSRSLAAQAEGAVAAA